ncbi:ATP-dependent RNA helicase dhx29 (DEAH box protein 29) [Durusdinium trenchii]|uniref:ATP-dependent RNA helicase dhx29 (DEAH box protein 29) n=1 Tax=Durusdinium trenchii TaxID=1381693 RepID=A0ABP0J2J1_9DINO
MDLAHCYEMLRAIGCDDEAETCDASYEAETMRALSYMDHTRINYDLLELLLEYIEGSDQFAHVPRDQGAILVFLPGMMEITKMHERLRGNPLFSDPSSCLVLTLHSMLSGEDHAKVFDAPRKGVRKIVLSTNIAETGVTIPDVVFVVDSGKVKCQRYHEPSNTSSLKEQFISKAEVMQRKGRAGRVQKGFGFTLLTQNRFQLRLQAMPTPEILRCSLMELMLSVLSSGLQPSCFSEALDPPPKSRVDQAVTTLRATGAVEEGAGRLDQQMQCGGAEKKKRHGAET